jgi:hypothetical protein
LYQKLWDQPRLATLIERNAREKGWLIFFTHEVVDDPDEFGCTPSLLEFAIREATSLGCRVLAVNHALEYITSPPG